MKKLFFLLAIALCSLSGYGQSIYTKEASRQFPYVIADSGFIIPFRDTALYRNTVRPGIIVCNTSDTIMYLYTGVSWQAIGSGGSATSNKVDSVTIAGVGTDDYLFYWINGISYGTLLPYTAGWKVDLNTGVADALSFGTNNNYPIKFYTDSIQRAVIDSTTGYFGLGNILPDKILDVASTTGGILIPRMSSGQMVSIVVPLEGELIYNTDEADFFFYSEITGAGLWTKVGSTYVYDATVNFGVNANPNTGGTTFNPNTPNLTTVIYVSDINNSLWTWNGALYVVYTDNNWKVGGNLAVTTGADLVAKIGTRNNSLLGFITNDTVRGIVDSSGILAETANTVPLGIDTVTKKFTYSSGGSGGTVVVRDSVSAAAPITYNASTGEFGGDTSTAVTGLTTLYQNGLKLNKADSIAGGYYPFSSNPAGYLTTHNNDSTTASNGLTMTSKDVKLGGTLVNTTLINTSTNPFTIIRGGIDTLFRIDPVNLRFAFGDITGSGSGTHIAIDDNIGRVNIDGDLRVQGSQNFDDTHQNIPLYHDQNTQYYAAGSVTDSLWRTGDSIFFRQRGVVPGVVSYAIGGTPFGIYAPTAGSGANALGTYLVQTATNAPANAQVMASLSTGIVKNTTTTGVQSIAVAGDFPTLNQNTTGSAASLTTTRTIWGQNFNGTANVSGTLALGASDLTMTGSIAATGSRVTKGWFTDIESTNMPTVSGTSLTTVAQTLQNKTITNSNNVLGGVTMTLGSDASWDIYTRNASGILERLGNGTTGQFLGANSGAKPSWQTPAGGGTVTSVSGTTNRITSTGGATPVIDISSTYDAAVSTKISDSIDANAATIRNPASGDTLFVEEATNQYLIKSIVKDYGMTNTSPNDSTVVLKVDSTVIQKKITLTTTGTSGAATFNGTTLNIPQYTGGGGGSPGGSGSEMQYRVDASTFGGTTGATATSTKVTLALPGINNVSNNYTTTATAAGTTTLTVTSNYDNFFTGTTTQNCDMPDATTLTAGMGYHIVNNSTGVVTVRSNGGATIKALAAGTELFLQVTNIGSAAGTWQTSYSTDLAVGTGTATKISYAAGTTSVAPINLAPGTVQTTPNDGDIEMNGDAMYATTDADNRGVIPVVNLIIQSSSYALTSTTSEQKLFNAVTNGTLTLETGTYFFEALFSISGLSATSGNGAFDILGAGTSTLGTVLYHAVGVDGNTATAATQTGSTMVAAQSPASMQTAGTGTTWNSSLRGTFRVTGAGTIIPSVSLVTAAAGTVAAGSYFRVWRVGSTSLTSIGQWN